MAWSSDDLFRLDIVRALTKVTIRGFRRALSEEDREQIARTIVDQLQLSRWQWWREPKEIEPGYMSRMPERPEDNK